MTRRELFAAFGGAVAWMLGVRKAATPSGSRLLLAALKKRGTIKLPPMTVEWVVPFGPAALDPRNPITITNKPMWKPAETSNEP